MKILYFAWLRQKVGKGEEMVDPPPTINNVAALVVWLKSQSPAHAEAFASIKAVRVAINQEFAEWNAPIAAGDEIAFFPPVTGG
ncbi:MAG: molybdopterin converting factor subunit 1 [Rhodospirillaceae bacterium]|nr:molybdopterin converting factor subunit 1 [Rhodospirillaceae bacterium]